MDESKGEQATGNRKWHGISIVGGEGAFDARVPEPGSALSEGITNLTGIFIGCTTSHIAQCSSAGYF